MKITAATRANLRTILAEEGLYAKDRDPKSHDQNKPEHYYGLPPKGKQASSEGWQDVFKMLDEKFPRYDVTTLDHWKQLFKIMRGAGVRRPSAIAHWYEEYRSGGVDLRGAAKALMAEGVDLPLTLLSKQAGLRGMPSDASLRRMMVQAEAKLKKMETLGFDFKLRSWGSGMESRSYEGFIYYKGNRVAYARDDGNGGQVSFAWLGVRSVGGPMKGREDEYAHSEAARNLCAKLFRGSFLGPIVYEEPLPFEFELLLLAASSGDTSSSLDKMADHKPVRLTKKEIDRADYEIPGKPFTIVVRPQADGTYWIAAIDLNTGHPLLGWGNKNLGQMYVDSKMEIPRAISSVGRDLHKLTGYGTNMTNQMRHEHYRGQTPPRGVQAARPLGPGVHLIEDLSVLGPNFRLVFRELGGDFFGFEQVPGYYLDLGGMLKLVVRAPKPSPAGEAKAKKVIAKVLAMFKEGSSKTAGGSGALNSAFLQRSPLKDDILKAVAKHYGISTAQAEEELSDPDAEPIYEYIGNNPALRRRVFTEFSR